MPLIQRNSLTFSNLVYSSGRYQNPVWISSLSPSKVGSGEPQWNASQILGYQIVQNSINSGEYLYFTGSGWITLPASGGSGGSGVYFTAESGVILDGSVLKMGGTGQLSKLNFESPSYYGSHSGVVISDLLNGFINYENIFIGSATPADLEGYMNVSIGSDSMIYSSGDRNVAIGRNSLAFSSSEECVAIGVEAVSNIVNFSYSNVGIGSYSLSSSSSIGNMLAIGDSAFNSVNVGSHSIAIGYYAGSLSSGLYNDIFIGDGAGGYSSGSGNIYIGINAGNHSLGSNNFELLTGSSSSAVGNLSNKLNISNFIRGDSSEKKVSIGHVSNFNPSGFLHVLSSGSPGIVIEYPSSNIYNFLTCLSGSSGVLNVDYSGNISGNNAVFNIISGALSPSIIQSTGLALTDYYHGKIIEHTGVSIGVYTIGSITVPSWQCTLVNYGGGISVASGSNIIRSKSNFTNISTLHSYGSIYRRPNGEFFLYGELN